MTGLLALGRPPRRPAPHRRCRNPRTLGPRFAPYAPVQPQAHRKRGGCHRTNGCVARRLSRARTAARLSPGRVHCARVQCILRAGRFARGGKRARWTGLQRDGVLCTRGRGVARGAGSPPRTGRAVYLDRPFLTVLEVLQRNLSRTAVKITKNKNMPISTFLLTIS